MHADVAGDQLGFKPIGCEPQIKVAGEHGRQQQQYAGAVVEVGLSACCMAIAKIDVVIDATVCTAPTAAALQTWRTSLYLSRDHRIAVLVVGSR